MSSVASELTALVSDERGELRRASWKDNRAVLESARPYVDKWCVLDTGSMFAARNDFCTSGSLAIRIPCAMSVTSPGAESTSKRLSTPTKNSGGPIKPWIAPNCTPSISRGMDPSWLAG